MFSKLDSFLPEGKQIITSDKFDTSISYIYKIYIFFNLMLYFIITPRVGGVVFLFP